MAEHRNWKPAQGSPAEAEAAEAIAQGLGTVLLPAMWRAVVEFSSAAVEHGEALAVVLRVGHTLTAPMIARGALESAQAACWLLEPTHGGIGTAEARVTAVQRAARGQLVELFSLRHYRDTLEKLVKTSPSDSAREGLTRARSELKELRASLVAAFGDGTIVNGDPSGWRLGGEALPGLTEVSEWFFQTMTLSRGLGVYDAVSGYTHPTLWALREHQHAEPTDDGGVSSRGPSAWTSSRACAQQLRRHCTGCSARWLATSDGKSDESTAG